MKKNKSHCPINYTLEIVGDKWTLLIIRDIVLLKKKTYGELKNSPEKIATNILANRLSWLEREGILDKQPAPDNNKVFHYTLTQKGIDLIPLLLEMSVWGATYDPKTAAPQAIIHRIKNKRLEVINEILKSLKSPSAKPFKDPS